MKDESSLKVSSELILDTAMLCKVFGIPNEIVSGGICSSDPVTEDAEFEIIEPKQLQASHA